MGKLFEISIAGRKCLCVSGKVVSWSIHWDIRLLVAMLTFETLELYIVRPVVDGRPREATGGLLEATGQFPRTDFGPVSGI